MINVVAAILIVDDEAPVIHVARAALERAGHKVYTASSGAEAHAFARAIPRVDVLIVDHRIPPDRGRDIAERLLVFHPGVRVVHMSGYSLEDLETEGSLTPGAAFLPKPFTIQQIQDVVAALV